MKIYSFCFRNDLGGAVKQPRLALGSTTFDNNLFNSSEIWSNYNIFIFTLTSIEGRSR
jgi:hypothetical protein